MNWLAPNATALVLPLHPTLSYQPGDEKLVDGLTMHYLGQPKDEDKVIGYGAVPPRATANYQIGNGYPGFAYTWQVDPSGALYQAWDTDLMTWHTGGPRSDAYPNIGWHNVHSRGVLLTGFGIEGEPTDAQIATVGKLARDYGKYLGRPLRIYAHKDLGNTDCPGNKSHLWIPQIWDAMKVRENMTDEQKAELQRVANIFAAWQAALDARAQQAVALGYGITDSFSARIADELKGAVESLRKMAS